MPEGQGIVINRSHFICLSCHEDFRADDGDRHPFEAGSCPECEGGVGWSHREDWFGRFQDYPYYIVGGGCPDCGIYGHLGFQIVEGAPNVGQCHECFGLFRWSDDGNEIIAFNEEDGYYLDKVNLPRLIRYKKNGARNG